MPLSRGVTLVTFAALFGCGAASGVSTQEPTAELRALGAVEGQLLAAPVVHVRARLRAAADEGLEPAYVLEAELWIDDENRVSLEIHGTYLEQEIELSLLCDGTMLRVGRRARPAAPDLAQGLLVALVRTGLLDVFEDLYRGELPGAADGRSVVEARSPFIEALTAEGRSALLVESVSGPPDHAFIVEGRRRSGRHVLLWEGPEGAAPGLRVETLGGFSEGAARFEHYEVSLSDAAPDWVFSRR